MDFRPCKTCGTIHELVPCPTSRWQCTKCGTTITHPKSRQFVAKKTIAAALGALILYVPATLLPILTIEQLGQRHVTSLLTGCLDLIREGHFFVGFVVILFSIIFPLVKIIGLLELCWFGLLQRKHQALMYQVMEITARWSMLDVLLLALLVMVVKLGGIVEFHIGPAVFAFVGCVAMNVLAAARFDPHAIWE